MHKKRLLVILLIVVLIFSSCDFSADNPGSKSSDEVLFHFIDVGQGDCILIQGGGKNILLDAGTGSSGGDIYTYLKSLGINYLDYFIGSHPHDDHLGGATAVFTSIDVGTVFLNSDISTSYFYENFIDVLLDKNVTPIIPDMDCIYEIGPFRIKFLSPKKDFGDTNNNSLVLTVQYEDVKALFTGDSERAVEAELLKNKKDIDADILKVGHHGSRNGSSAAFLNAVSPSVAVIQCGENNSYGHPHIEAVERLEAINAEILRTDELGTIVLRTDGKTVWKDSGEIVEIADEVPEIDLIFIANKKSKIFHSEACPNLPSEKNSITFPTRDEAVNSGYKPCGNCNP